MKSKFKDAVLDKACATEIEPLLDALRQTLERIPYSMETEEDDREKGMNEYGNGNE